MRPTQPALVYTLNSYVAPVERVEFTPDAQVEYNKIVPYVVEPTTGFSHVFFGDGHRCGHLPDLSGAQMKF